MSELKYTKSTLRDQERKLKQLENYLPTLQLKKKLLQFEINIVHIKLEKLFQNYQIFRDNADQVSMLLTAYDNGNIEELLQIKRVVKNYENVAGIEIPIFQKVVFEDRYFFLNTPVWFDGVCESLKGLIEINQRINVAEEKKRALVKEFKEVSIRVNLFEKILIPRTKGNIKKIKVFLQDQELAAISQAKVAKTKILKKYAYKG